MHDRLDQDMARAIEALSDSEKLELIEELAHSLRAAEKGNHGGQLSPGEKKRLLESVRRISALPMEGPGGFSGRDHDQVLYGPSARPGWPV